MTTRYEHLLSGENARTMCNDCGCNVIDQRLHDKFHDNTPSIEDTAELVAGALRELGRELSRRIQWGVVGE